MYLGKIMEVAEKDEFFNNPLLPYTEALLSAIASLRPSGKERIIIKGDVPSPLRMPSGCRYHTRCHRVMPICSQVEPPVDRIVTPATSWPAIYTISYRFFDHVGAFQFVAFGPEIVPRTYAADDSDLVCRIVFT